jgi:predicted AAA+ superfamily ATPase
MMLAAQRNGKRLNHADLTRDATLRHPATHRYLNLLETGCLVTRIRPVATSPSAALVRAPKLFWTDCGLAAWLAGIKSSADGTQRLHAGFGLEQTLLQTLDTWPALALARRKLHFWRDRGGHEVDFILEEAGKLVALEIKAGSQVTSDPIGICACRDAVKRKASLVRGVVLA